MIWVKEFEWNGGLNNRRQKNWLINTRLVFIFSLPFFLLFKPLFCRLYFSADSDIYESFTEPSSRSNVGLATLFLKYSLKFFPEFPKKSSKIPLEMFKILQKNL